MSPKRAFLGMVGALVVLSALFIAAAYFGSKFITREGDSLTSLKLEAAVLEKQSEALQRAKRDIKDYEELEAIAKTIVPQDKDQAQTVLELVKLANESGIAITSVQFPASQLGAASKNSKQKGTNPDLTQLTALSSPKGVYSMRIDLETNKDVPVSYNQLLDFLRRLENNRRTAQVTDISITPDEGDRTIVSFTLALTSYVKP